MSEDSMFDDDQPDDLMAIPPRSARKKRKPFTAQWVKLPRYWVEALRRSKSVSTYQLALAILFEAFKREHLIGEIVLSSTLTKMPRNTKMRAVRELVELGLIKIKQDGNQAARVTLLHSKRRR
jgi:hypothetical protein